MLGSIALAVLAVLLPLVSTQEVWTEVSGKVTGPGDVDWYERDANGDQTFNWWLDYGSKPTTPHFTSQFGYDPCASSLKGNASNGGIPDSEKGPLVGLFCYAHSGCIDGSGCTMNWAPRVTKYFGDTTDTTGTEFTVGGSWLTAVISSTGNEADCNTTNPCTQSCPMYAVMTNIICVDATCAMRKIECSNITNPLFRLQPGGISVYSGADLQGFSEGGWYDFTSQGWIVTGMKCTAANCSDLRIFYRQVQVKTCSNGYVLQGADCVGLPCPVLPAITNGSVSTTNGGDYPSSAVYTCTPGYTAGAQAMARECQYPSGGGALFWAGSEPSCAGELCVPLDPPVNGDVTITNGGIFPSEAVHTCDAGYVPSVVNRTCGTNKLWSGSPSVCLGVNCTYTPPVWPLEEDYQTNDGKYPSTMGYKCGAGFILEGSTARFCETSGSYGGVAPQCKGKICPIPATPLNGAVTATNTHYTVDSETRLPTTKARFTCDYGYQVTGGSAELTCNDDSTWDQTPPTCEPILCEKSGNTTSNNARVVSESNSQKYPSTITFACMQNFLSSATMTGTCETANINSNVTFKYPDPPNCTKRYIKNGTTTINGANVSTFNNCNGTHLVTFQGEFGERNVTSVTFGPSGFTDKYACDNVTITDAGPVFRNISCTAQAGVGGNLIFEVRIAEFPTVAIYNPDPVSFPTPTIKSNSLRLFGGAGTTSLMSAHNRGDKLTLDGAFFGLNYSTDVHVTLKAPPPTGIVCVVDPDLSSDSSLTCTLPGGDGGPFEFYITVGGQTSDRSTDRYQYSAGPVVNSVAGCPLDIGNGTTQCPTDGLDPATRQPMVINITGTGFTKNASQAPIVYIAYRQAMVLQSPQNYSETNIFVELPAAIGSNQAVVVSSGEFSSFATFKLSYAVPNVTDVKGCVNRTLCSRDGGDVITITGNNFGSGLGETGGSNPIVVQLAGASCENVTHDAFMPHKKVTCNLPPGKGLGKRVMMIQPNGGLAYGPANLVLSYEMCPAGTRENVSTTDALNCIPCSAGSYTPSASELTCRPCLPGTYSNSDGAQACLESDFGYYVSGSSSTNQTACPAGSYANTEKNIQCTSCPAGKYSNDTGTRECIFCEAGKAQSKSNQTQCEFCAPGKFADKQMSEQCEECADGFVSLTQGQNVCAQCNPGKFSFEGTECRNCTAGTFQDNAKQTACESCEAGRFSNSSGAQVCHLCPAGFYQNVAGKDHCIGCQSGRYSKETRSIACEFCIPGTANNKTGQTACVACKPGTSARNTGAQLCTVCDPGTFSNKKGSDACTNCLVGTATSLPNQTDCLECVPGRHAPVAGRTECDECEQGKAAALSRQAFCTDCTVGSFTNNRSSTRCVSCAAGRYAGYDGAVMCEKCLEGTYSPAVGARACVLCKPGSYSNDTGTVTCTQCAKGTYAPESKSKKCLLCAPGNYAGSEGSRLCDECIAGSYAQLHGSSQCSFCEPGSFSEDRASTTCELCPKGTYSLERASGCTLCPGDTVSSYEGASSCEQCNNSVSNKEKTACECPAGYFSIQLKPFAPRTCEVCPQGAICNHPGTVFETMETKPAYWRPANDSLNYYRCVLPQHCGGGYESKCNTFRTGPLCGTCLPGYTSARSTSACAKCAESKRESWLSTAAVLGLVFLCVIVMYAVMLKLGDSQAQRLAAVSEKRTLAVARDYRRGVKGFDDAALKSQNSETMSGLDGEMDDNNLRVALSLEDDDRDDLDLVYSKKPKKSKDAMSLASRRAPNFMFKTKIMVSFLQIANVIAFQGDISWPKGFQAFIGIFQIFNLDFIPWQSIGCATQLNFYWKAILTGLTPVGMFVFIILIFFLPSYCMDRRDMSDSVTYRVKREAARGKFVKMSLFTVFLLYPHVSSMVLGVWNCKKVEDTWYLMGDFSLTCYTEEWFKFALPMIVFIVLYPFGIPAVYFFVLRAYKVDMREPKVILKLGFLYEAYSDQAWFFELLDMLHKLSLTSLVVFLPNDMEMMANMGILVMYLIIILMVQPYVRKGDDRLHQLVQVELFLLALMGHTMQSMGMDILTDDVDLLISIGLISITGLLFGGFLIMSLRNMKKMCRHTRLRKNKKVSEMKEERELLESQERLCAVMQKKKIGTEWVSRCIVLCDDMLEYYSDNNRKKLVGMIPVSHIKDAHFVEGKKNIFEFDIRADKDVKFQMMAADRATAMRWVLALQVLSESSVENAGVVFGGKFWKDTNQMRTYRLSQPIFRSNILHVIRATPDDLEDLTLEKIKGLPPLTPDE